MQRPINPEWPLRQADELAGRDATTRGQPRNANLRRSVSAAYYALFHFIIGCAAEKLLPSCTHELRYRMTRHYQHNAVKQVCTWVLPQNQPAQRVREAILRIRESDDLIDVADAFIQLQEARHEADYDHLADFTRPGSLALIDMAYDARNKLSIQEELPKGELFLAHVSMASRLQP